MVNKIKIFNAGRGECIRKKSDISKVFLQKKNSRCFVRAVIKIYRVVIPNLIIETGSSPSLLKFNMAFSMVSLRSRGPITVMTRNS